jgi:hypothetical protein
LIQVKLDADRMRNKCRRFGIGQAIADDQRIMETSMTKIRRLQMAKIAGYGALVGAAGGLAEIVWIALYGALTGSDASEVARAVSAVASAVLPGALAAAPVAAGIMIHMIIATALGIALVLLWSALPSRQSEYSFMLAALTAVWAFNFLLFLPLIGPGFVEVVPYPASLFSKLMFGVAAAAMLRHGAGTRPALIRAGSEA